MNDRVIVFLTAMAALSASAGHAAAAAVSSGSPAPLAGAGLISLAIFAAGGYAAWRANRKK